MKISKNALAIIGFIACVAIYQTAKFYDKKDQEELDQHALTTVCTFYDTEIKHFGYRFTVGDKTYRGSRRKRNSSIRNGDTYEIEYLERDPNINRIRFDSPVIGDDFLTTEPESMRYASGGKVDFSYSVGNKSFGRVAYLKENIYDRALFEVKYSPTKPYLGYLVKKQEAPTSTTDNP